MAESILDRLDRSPGGARQYVATLIVAGGASRAEVAAAMAKKYGIKPPTGRSVTTWQNHDPELRALIEQMQAAKRDIAPGDNLADFVPREVNLAQVDSDLFSVADEFPAFGELLVRSAERGTVSDAGTPLGAFEQADPRPPPRPDAVETDDVFAVLLAEHETDADFAADCERRVAAEAV